MRTWRDDLIQALRQPDSLRVFTTNELHIFAHNRGLDVSRRMLDIFCSQYPASDICRSREISRVRKGLWINNCVIDRVSRGEAANRIRSGAIVSLFSVLPESMRKGFPYGVHTVVGVPRDSTRPSVGSIETGIGEFHFKGIQEGILLAGDENDRIATHHGTSYATPEAAIIHWFHLSSVKGKSFPKPKVDFSAVSKMDYSRLERLGRETRYYSEIMLWAEKCLHKAS